MGETRRMLGVDVGERWIGLAFSEGRVAVPLAVIEHRSRDADLERVSNAAREREVDAVVVGLPLDASGGEGLQARRSRRFGEALSRRLDVPVLYHDERLSSVDAEAATRSARQRAKRGRRVDDVAAALILQAYLDSSERSG